MAERLVPVDWRPDWPRIAAQIVNRLLLRTAKLETTTDWAALAASPSYADDTAAAAGGVAVGALYLSGSTVKVRVT